MAVPWDHPQSRERSHCACGLQPRAAKSDSLWSQVSGFVKAPRGPGSSPPPPRSDSLCSRAFELVPLGLEGCGRRGSSTRSEATVQQGLPAPALRHPPWVVLSLSSWCSTSWCFFGADSALGLKWDRGLRPCPRRICQPARDLHIKTPASGRQEPVLPRKHPKENALEFSKKI